MSKRTHPAPDLSELIRELERRILERVNTNMLLTLSGERENSFAHEKVAHDLKTLATAGDISGQPTRLNELVGRTQQAWHAPNSITAQLSWEATLKELACPEADHTAALARCAQAVRTLRAGRQNGQNLLRQARSSQSPVSLLGLPQALLELSPDEYAHLVGTLRPTGDPTSTPFAGAHEWRAHLAALSIVPPKSSRRDQALSARSQWETFPKSKEAGSDMETRAQKDERRLHTLMRWAPSQTAWLKPRLKHWAELARGPHERTLRLNALSWSGQMDSPSVTDDLWGELRSRRAIESSPEQSRWVQRYQLPAWLEHMPQNWPELKALWNTLIHLSQSEVHRLTGEALLLGDELNREFPKRLITRKDPRKAQLNDQIAALHAALSMRATLLRSLNRRAQTYGNCVQEKAAEQQSGPVRKLSRHWTAQWAALHHDCGGHRLLSPTVNWPATPDPRLEELISADPPEVTERNIRQQNQRYALNWRPSPQSYGPERLEDLLQSGLEFWSSRPSNEPELRDAWFRGLTHQVERWVSNQNSPRSEALELCAQLRDWPRGVHAPQLLRQAATLNDWVDLR